VSSLGDEEGSKEKKEVVQPHSAEGKATCPRRFLSLIYENLVSIYSVIAREKISSRRLVEGHIPSAAIWLAQKLLALWCS
jgi:putative intracellular protease/amidase